MTHSRLRAWRTAKKRSIDLASLKVDEGAQGGKIVAMYPAHDAQPVESMEDGKKAAVITDVTAFHAEGGGQLGDTGRIIAPAGVMQVEITKKLLKLPKNCRTAQPL